MSITLSLLATPALAAQGGASAGNTGRSEVLLADSTLVSDNGSAAKRGTKGLRERKAANDDSRYGAREQQSGKAQDYRGGDTLVIGATTVTIVLAVILLIVLL